jgi:cell division protein FtsL
MQPPTSESWRRWANRPVTREVDRHGAQWLWCLVLAAVVAAVPAATYQLQQNECLRLTYEVNELTTRYERLVEEERRLTVRRAAAGSLDAIETWALRNGMVHPAAEQIVVVREQPQAETVRTTDELRAAWVPPTDGERRR